MTETQAKSGAAGASTNPVDEEAGGAGTPATGRTAVGRAVVPADAPSPKFTRAPGMQPPPDQLPEESAATSSEADSNLEDTAPAATESGDTVTSAVASSPAPRATVSAGRAEPVGRAEQTAPTSRLEQPGSSSRTERIPTRTERPAVPTASGSELTQPISSAQQGAFRPGRAGGTPQPQTPTSRFGFGGPAARPGTGVGGTGAAAAGGAAAGSAGGAGAVGAARVTEAVRAARSTVSSAASRGPRRARLNLKRIDPWSVMKFSFAVSLVLFIVVIVATSVLYLALDAMGVFDSVNGTLTDMLSATGGQGGSTFKITAKGVILTSGLIGLVNVVLFTALATLAAFIYNVCADLVGGVELTLAERD
ncbi:DUF3566 domain-containing protein [Plantactinospora sp. S1510]|uniref:DUF3566 domain-containing protein n=1 Tax=Plantactinospora alkalitolerans TaxID=2789879 RepID=A0ABS0H6Y7_9ACTN|nr:DUF3566 domain-containing protein [Plantactinospora alkalitolerans]MBF9134203.1 DUF3566 domain-containing protein [Plantactinospora alkalitolerans]